MSVSDEGSTQVDDMIDNFVPTWSSWVLKENDVRITKKTSKIDEIMKSLDCFIHETHIRVSAPGTDLDLVGARVASENEAAAIRCIEPLVSLAHELLCPFVCSLCTVIQNQLQSHTRSSDFQKNNDSCGSSSDNSPFMDYDQSSVYHRGFADHNHSSHSSGANESWERGQQWKSREEICSIVDRIYQSCSIRVPTNGPYVVLTSADPSSSSWRHPNSHPNSSLAVTQDFDRTEQNQYIPTASVLLLDSSPLKSIIALVKHSDKTSDKTSKSTNFALTNH